MMTLASSNLGASRQWVTLMSNQQGFTSTGQMFSVPSFAQLYNGKTKFKSNEKGQWFTWSFEFKEQLSGRELTPQQRALRTAGLEFNKLIAQGLIKVDITQADIGGQSESSSISVDVEGSAAY
jgi:hypothetical protein